MANIVVTSTADNIKVDYGDYYPDTSSVQIAYYSKRDLARVELIVDRVIVTLFDKSMQFELTFDGGTEKTLQVDSIDGVAPTSNDDLTDKIGALMNIDYGVI